MKYFILFSLIISNSSYSVAVVDDPAKCDACKPVMSGTAVSAIPEETRSIASLGASENIQILSRTICGFYSTGGNEMVSGMKTAILDHMKDYEKLPNPTNGQILKFLNRNKNFMTCGHDNRNYMVVAFDNGTAHNELFANLFLGELYDDDEEVFIDINAISYTAPGGKPETVLDYMYRKYEEVNVPLFKKEIKQLIDEFEGDYGAKRYASLPQNEKDLILAVR